MKELPPDPQMSFLIGWCLILLLAVPMGGLAAWHVASKAAAVSWPRASAEILSSDFYRTTKPALWCIKLRLRYEVGGRSYESRRTSSSQVAGTGCDREKRVIETRLERMQPGDRIKVRYDPQDPGDAVVYLAPVMEFGDVFFGIIAAVWFGCGIFAIRTGKKERREQDAVRAASVKPALR